MSRAYLTRHLNWHDEAGEAARQHGVGVVARRPDLQTLLPTEPWPSLGKDAAEACPGPVEEDSAVQVGHLSLLRDMLLLVAFLALVLVGFAVFDRHGTIEPDFVSAPAAQTPLLSDPLAR